MRTLIHTCMKTNVCERASANSMYVKDTLYSCLQDQFVQEWTGIVDAGRKCTLYKHFLIYFLIY